MLILVAISIGVAFLIPRRYFAADDFSGDWYGYVTNQMGHALLIGVGATFALAEIYQTLVGVHPYRWQLFLAMLAGYSTFELRQGWRRWDTCEDILFSVVYGAGGVLWVFRADSTESHLIAEPDRLTAVLTAMTIHLILGILRRRQERDLG